MTQLPCFSISAKDMESADWVLIINKEIVGISDLRSGMDYDGLGTH
jgi:hypothetical protein